MIVLVQQIERKRLPDWFRRSIPVISAEKTHDVLAEYRLNTVCESALCPNRSECYSHKTATFMILGNVCTRRCGFCAIDSGRPQTVEADEPLRVAKAAAALGLQYVVVTSVARDEMPDEGAGHFAETISALKLEIPGAKVEVLTPDFHARRELIARVVEAGPSVYNHNLETVERLQKKVRPQASYERSLQVLQTVRDLSADVTVKSGLMLGLGETREEIFEAAQDLRSSGCQILTLGQYLSPSSEHLPIEAFISPQEFSDLRAWLLPLGFKEIFAGPNVRSSYHAGETFLNAVGEARES